MNVLGLPRDHLEVELDGIPPLGRIHAWVRDFGADEQRADDVVSLINELVTNAHRHAAAPRRVRLRQVGDRGVMRVEVEDGSPSLLPILGQASGAQGEGLLLVNRLSVNWGCDRSGERKTVWAEIAAR